MKKFDRVTLPLLFLVAVLSACAPTGSQPSSELAATTDIWTAALNAGDVEAVAALYAEDARLLPPNAAMTQGREAVRQEFGAMVAAGLKGELATLEAVVAGDIGYKVGTYTVMGPDGSVIDRGKFIEVWQQVGGDWQIINDIWNSDMPVPNLLVTHNVEDAERWLAAWRGPNSRHGLFAQNGAPSVRVFQSAQDPNLTGLLIGVTDMDAFQAMLESPEGAAAKAADGVVDASMRVFTEVQ